MTSGLNFHFGRFLVIVLMVAGVTFEGLSWLQMQQSAPALIQGGTISPDATLEQVVNHIQQLPPIPQFSGQETIGSGDVEQVRSGIQLDTGVDLDGLMDELLSIQSGDVHRVGDEDYDSKLETLCASYQEVCSITILDGNYTPKQQFAYQLMVIYLTTKLQQFGYDPMDSLRNLTINNYTRYRRGYANAKLIVLNTYQMLSNKEFLQVLAHEMGHVVDLGVIVGTSKQINPDYTEFGKAKFSVDDQSLPFYAISWINEDTMRANMNQSDFVSGYGMTNPFEDFAECHNMYLYHRAVFAYLASTSVVLQRKYDYFDKLYQGKYLSANFNSLDLTQLDVSVRPWDTTRM